MITVLAMPNDRAKAEAIVDAMVSDGLEVWNETVIPGGERWRSGRETPLRAFGRV